jgi:hypothetical protein
MGVREWLLDFVEGGSAMIRPLHAPWGAERDQGGADLVLLEEERKGKGKKREVWWIFFGIVVWRRLPRFRVKLFGASWMGGWQAIFLWQACFELHATSPSPRSILILVPHLSIPP